VNTPGFPGGTSVSRLSVYPDACSDGVAGGTPHLHTASTEGYVVVGGTGELHTLGPTGFTRTPLEPGSTVWFTPGTIHRAVNHGDLQVVVVMQNAGLPEAGDAVMTFPLEIIKDPGRYRAAATLPVDGAAAAVLRRRELAVEGFHALVDGARRGDFGPLHAFYDAAIALVRPAIAGWRAIWAETVELEARATARLLDAMERGDGSHLTQAALLESPQSAEPRWGMCGRLRTHDVAHPVVRSTPGAQHPAGEEH
jgi:mannose-6-phosphate isomerase-like protein (cupin superfamily)